MKAQKRSLYQKSFAGTIKNAVSSAKSSETQAKGIKNSGAGAPSAAGPKVPKNSVCCNEY